MSNAAAKVGQVWESRDPRDHGRRVIVVSSQEDGYTELAPHPWPLTSRRRGSLVRTRTLHRTYRLVEDAA